MFYNNKIRLATIKTYSWICALIILSFFGVWAVMYVTSMGPGVSPDSVTYIGVADSLREGSGFYIPFNPARLAEPMVHFPPLYPLVLAIFGFLAGDPMAAARYVNAFSFGVLILLVGFIIYRITRGSYLASFLGSVLLASAKPMLIIHAWAWTEPLFALSGLSGLYILSIYMEKQRLRHLVIVALLFSVAFLLRYSGIYLVIILFLFSVGLPIFKKERSSKWLKYVGLVFSIVILPAFFWMARDTWLTGTATNRSIVYHPVRMGTLVNGLNTILIWFTPSNDHILKWILFPLVLILVICSIGVYVWQKYPSDRSIVNSETSEKSPNYLLKVLLVDLLVYPFFLLFSISFYDVTTPLNDRILSTEFIPALILAIWVFHEASISLNKSHVVSISVRVLLLALFLFIATGWVTEARSWVLVYHRIGLGYNSLESRESKTLLAIESMPPDSLIYTNSPDEIYAITKRHSIELPRKESPYTTIKYSDYAEKMENMGEQLRQKNGVIVYFYYINRAYLPDEAELGQKFPLNIVLKTGDGIIYRISN